MPSPTPGFMPSAEAIAPWRYEALPLWKAARTAAASGWAEPFCARETSALTKTGDRIEPSISKPKTPVSDFMLAPFAAENFEMGASTFSAQTRKVVASGPAVAPRRRQLLPHVHPNCPLPRRRLPEVARGHGDEYPHDCRIAL